MELSFGQRAFGNWEFVWEYQKSLKSGYELWVSDFSKV